MSASAIIDDPDAGWNQGANHRSTTEPFVSLNQIGQDIWDTSEEKGFHEPLPPGIGEKAVKLLLIISEVCEAFEDIRKDIGDHDEEIADTLIRVLEYSANEGVDIDAEVNRKMEKNRGRPYKHGKKF